MAARQILAQLNLVEVAALSASGANFFGFGAKADGLYMKDNAAADVRLLTTADAGVNVAAYSHTHSGYQASLSGNGFVKISGTTITYDNTSYVSGTPWTSMGYVTGTPWTGMGYVTGTPWTGMGYLTANQAHTLDSHLNVTITSNVAGEILKWNGTAWVNNTLAEAGIQPAGTYVTGTPWTSMGYITNVGTGNTNTLSLTGTTTPVFTPVTAAVVSAGTALTTGGQVYTFVTGQGYVTGTPWTSMGYVTGTPWTGMGYLTGITKANVEAVLTGDITTHTHSTYATSGHTHSGVYAPVFTLTTTGSSGAATYSGNVLNIPQYAGTYSLPATGSGTLGGIKLGFTNINGAIALQTSSDMGFATLTLAAVEYALTGTNITSHQHNGTHAALAGSTGQVFSCSSLTMNGALAGATTIGASSIVTASDFQLSDIRLKRDIQPIDFSKIGEFDFKQFRMIPDKGNTLRYGVIAQQIEKSNPELIYTDSHGMKAVNYKDLLVLKIAQLEKRIKELEK